MTILSHATKASPHVQSNGARYVQHSFTDHLGDTVLLPQRLVNGIWGETEYATERVALVSDVEELQADQEVTNAVSLAEAKISSDKLSDYQVQPDFDRRVLGQAMLLGAYDFYEHKPIYDRVVTLGNTAAQRAAYLGITAEQWGEIDTRFSTIEAWDIDLEEAQIWPELPEVFE